MSFIGDTLGGLLDSVVGAFVPDVPSAPQAPTSVLSPETKTPKVATGQEIEYAKRRSASTQRKRSGRDSTILTAGVGSNAGTTETKKPLSTTLG